LSSDGFSEIFISISVISFIFGFLFDLTALGFNGCSLTGS